MSRVRGALLFDIDGTLLHSGGAGSRAVGRVLAGWLGREVQADGAEMAGRTDLEIFRRLLDRLQVPYPPPPERRELVRRYLRCLEEELQATPPQPCRGVPQFLEAIAADPGWAIGLVTGNLEPGAWIKLRHGGIASYFTFGAFGSDHEDRNELVPIALRRLKRRFAVTVPAQSAIVIGDTARDIACARAAGARVLAVATGSGRSEELQALAPDHFCADLSQTRATAAALTAMIAGTTDSESA